MLPFNEAFPFRVSWKSVNCLKNLNRYKNTHTNTQDIVTWQVWSYFFRKEISPNMNKPMMRVLFFFRKWRSLNHSVHSSTFFNHKMFVSILIFFHILHSQFSVNLLKPTGHVMHQQFNIQQLYVLPTLYLCVLYLSENKQRLVSLTA